MRTFKDIYAIAAKRKGGPNAVEARLDKPLPLSEIRKTTDDRWLSAMARSLFEAGFNWKVIESKWQGFEEAFDKFNVKRVAFYNDDELARLLKDKNVVRNGAKLEAVVANARFIKDVSAKHDSFGCLAASWPTSDCVGLLNLLEAGGARLGGLTGQRVLRRMGIDSFILSDDVVARLTEEKVIDKAPTSRRAMASVQQAFNVWVKESDRSLTEISQVLAASIDAS